MIPWTAASVYLKFESWRYLNVMLLNTFSRNKGRKNCQEPKWRSQSALVWLLAMSCLDPKISLGPFIRGKIRRELYHLCKHVLSRTRTARINGSRLISVLDSFSRECCPLQRQSNVARQKLTHAYYVCASYVRREGHLYKVFLVLAKTRLI